MSYCQFANTLLGLQQNVESLTEHIEEGTEPDLDSYETAAINAYPRAIRSLIRAARQLPIDVDWDIVAEEIKAPY